MEENLQFFAQSQGLREEVLHAAVEKNIVRFGLGERRRQKTGELSHGWRQRLKLAVALVHNPGVLLLDEATAGIDPVGRQELWNIIVESARAGMAVLLSTHHMDEAERCDRIGYLSDGALVLSGSPQELRARAAEQRGSPLPMTEALAELVKAAR
ncbi:MAG: ABC transporter ATP-binding protein [Acidobacteriota bacterium]